MSHIQSNPSLGFKGKMPHYVNAPAKLANKVCEVVPPFRSFLFWSLGLTASENEKAARRAQAEEQIANLQRAGDRRLQSPRNLTGTSSHTHSNAESRKVPTFGRSRSALLPTVVSLTPRGKQGISTFSRIDGSSTESTRPNSVVEMCSSLAPGPGHTTSPGQPYAKHGNRKMIPLKHPRQFTISPPYHQKKGFVGETVASTAVIAPMREENWQTYRTG
eukprot:GHVN01099994.1.p1 GENE.GHVN01099994.1~~GHVN01099994.1.p1  ORF type:complete len:218 (-),score=16.70 GHVN01099994.1:333-986(-)